MGVRVIVRSPPSDLANREIVDEQLAPGPLVPGAAPELAGDEWREREFAESPDLFREELVAEGIGIDPVPGSASPLRAGSIAV
ncbi:hypothetical protein [Methanoregula sp.]|uniref:hypothetical protein n=1 Tax=Methanoregula sp. TaxID=2052170 RepID=UPI003C73C13A